MPTVLLDIEEYHNLTGRTDKFIKEMERLGLKRHSDTEWRKPLALKSRFIEVEIIKGTWLIGIGDLSEGYVYIKEMTDTKQLSDLVKVLC